MKVDRKEHKWWSFFEKKLQAISPFVWAIISLFGILLTSAMGFNAKVIFNRSLQCSILVQRPKFSFRWIIKFTALKVRLLIFLRSLLTQSNIFTVRNEVAKVMFLHLSVRPQGGLTQCMLGYPPPPRSRHHPPRADPPTEQTPLLLRTYASYWNAFLLILNFGETSVCFVSLLIPIRCKL